MCTAGYAMHKSKTRAPHLRTVRSPMRACMPTRHGVLPYAARGTVVEGTGGEKREHASEDPSPGVVVVVVVVVVLLRPPPRFSAATQPSYQLGW